MQTIKNFKDALLHPLIVLLKSDYKIYKQNSPY